MPVMLATQETQIRRTVVQSQSGQIICETLSWKYPSHRKRAGTVAQDEGPCSSPSTAKKKKKIYIYIYIYMYIYVYIIHIYICIYIISHFSYYYLARTQKCRLWPWLETQWWVEMWSDWGKVPLVERIIWLLEICPGSSQEKKLLFKTHLNLCCPSTMWHWWVNEIGNQLDW
jgi:hypothetical protein